MRLVALFRVSTEKQATDGASLDAQKRVYREHAVTRGWTTIAEFRGCESATQASSDRAVLQQVLACIREESPDALYVHEQSRLTRGDELEVALLLRELREREIKIIVNGVVRDLTSLDDRFMVGIQSLVDRAEVDRIKERQERGKVEKAKQGRKNSGLTSYGYRNPYPGQPGRGTLQIVPEKAAVVRQIWEMAAKGLGTKTIAERLNSEAIPSPRGGRWQKTTIARILANPVYLGTHASRVWIAEEGSRTFRLSVNNPRAIVVPNAHEAIVPPDLARAVKSRTRPLPTKRPRLLTGMLTINGVKAHADSDSHQAFYTTSGATHNGAWLKSAIIDEMVWQSFVAAVLSPKLVTALIKAAETPNRRESAAVIVNRLKSEIARAQARLDTLIDMRANGEISRDIFRSKTLEMEQIIKEKRSRLLDLQDMADAGNPDTIRRAIAGVRVLLREPLRLTLEERRTILKSVLNRVDLKAVHDPQPFKRDSTGRITGSGGPAWKIAGGTMLFLTIGSGTKGAEMGIGLARSERSR